MINSSVACNVCKKDCKTDGAPLACESCVVYRCCSKKCIKSIFTKEHQKECAKIKAQQAAQDAADATDDIAFELHFTLNQAVVCQMGERWNTWNEGNIIEVRNTTYKRSGYLCRLQNGNTTFVRVEDEHNIRLLDYDSNNPLQRLLHHVRHEDSHQTLQSIVHSYSLDIHIVGPKVMFEAAHYGLTTVIPWLLTHKISLESVDEKGRNIMLIAVDRKQMQFINYIVNQHTNSLWSLLPGTDSRSMSVLHYLVLSNEEVMLSHFVASNSTLTHNMFDVNRIVKTETSRVCEHISTWCDLKGRTARDYAVMFKRLNLVTILDAFNQQVLFHKAAAECRMLESNRNKLGAESFIAAVEQSGVDTLSFKFHKIITRALVDIAFDLSSEAVFDKGLKWLHERRVLDLSVVRSDLPRHERSIVLQVLRGPSDQRLSMYQLTNSYDKSAATESMYTAVMGALHQCLYQALHHWDGVSDLSAYVLSIRGKKTEHSESSGWAEYEYGEYLIWHQFAGFPDYGHENGDRYKKYFHTYCEVLMRRLESQRFDERLQVFRWLIVDLQVSLPPLQQFMAFDQFRLLQWACDQGLIDLNVSLSSSPALVTYSASLSWFHAETDSRVTIGEFLCALAASLDELQIFQWLFSEKIADRDFRVGKEGLNMLHLTALVGSYICAKWLVANQLLVPLILSTSGDSAVEIAIKSGNVPLSVYLLPLVVVDAPPTDVEQLLLLAEQSLLQKDKRLVNWVATKRFSINVLALRHAVGSGVESASLAAWTEFLQKIDIKEVIWNTIYIRFSSHKRSIVHKAKKIESSFAEAGGEELENYVLFLAVESSNLDFFIQLRSFIDVKITESDMDGFYLKGCEEMLIALSECAAELKQTAVAELLTEWQTSTTDDVAEEKKLSETCRAFNQLLRNGESIASIEESIALQKTLLGDSKKHYCSYVHVLQEEYIIHVTKPKDELLPLLHHALREGFEHIVLWLFSFKTFTLRDLESALIFAAGDFGDLSTLQFLLHLIETALVREEDGESNTTPRPVSSAELSNMIHLALIAASGMQVKDKWAVITCRPKTAIYLFELALLRGIDVNAFVQDARLSPKSDDDKLIEPANVLFRTVIMLLICENADSWELLHYLVSRADVVSMKMTDSFHQPGRKSYYSLVGKMLFAHLFTHYGPLRMIFADSVADVSFSHEAQTAHFHHVLSLLLEHGLEVAPFEKEVCEALSERVLSFNDSRPAVEFMTFFAEEFGFDIQMLDILDIGFGVTAPKHTAMLKAAKAHQVQRWQLANAMSKGATLEKLTALLDQENGVYNFITAKYANGRSLLHIAAQNNRKDVIAWLVGTHHMDVHAVDNFGDSVLTMCHKAGSVDAERFMVTLIGSRKLAHFFFRHFHRRKFLAFKKRCITAVLLIQSAFRRFLVYRYFGPILQANRGTWERFSRVWGRVMGLLSGESKSRPVRLGWSSIKLQYDMMESVSAERGGEENLELQSLMTSAAASIEDVVLEGVDEADDELSYQVAELTKLETSLRVKVLDNIDLSAAVVKWLKSADSRLRGMFIARMGQLAEGDRSYALCKRLKGCIYPIYETKLDSGQRVLWTQLQRGIHISILVWFVSKHDDVGLLISHIDKSFGRLSVVPSVISASSLLTEGTNGRVQMLSLSEDNTLLDPMGNCPLKIYTATRGDIPLLTTLDYSPPLKLGAKQQEVQEMSGTVLLLGRSGTGKTVCLSDRMTRDREFLRVTSGVVASQLFVSRSRRLCEFVESYQTQHTADKSELESVDFMTLDSFVSHMESAVSRERGLTAKFYSASRQVSFERFATLMRVAITHSGLDAVVIWTQICSFIKGSIEAVMQRGPLTLEQYMDVSAFGLERCRLLPDQRRSGYAVYIHYAELLAKERLWDIADRVLELLNRSKLEPLHGSNSKGADYHKVYVDEVQDNTQAEIVLYFLAAGMNTQSLFLAGDPAQSVVEGVDFRFEEVRSIVFKLSDGQESIQRPIKLSLNYRSHAGILNCAAAILDKMFSVFPGSAKILPRDAGLFKGPRPVYCTTFGSNILCDVLRNNQRIIVICPDRSVQTAESMLSHAEIANTVLGVRAAKGLEFQDIVLYDFFGSIPTVDHKAWRNLLSNDHLSSKPYSHPQIESQLKLLYTAITRSCNRLIFIEAQNSSLCSAFFRWLTAKELAEPFVPTSENESAFMTSDEWRVRGIEFALSAEGESTIAFLHKAVNCFGLAGDALLSGRVQTQLDLETLHQRTLTSAGSDGGLMTPKDELDVASLVLKGLRAGMLEDVHCVCQVLAPSLKESQYFTAHVTNKVNNM